MLKHYLFGLLLVPVLLSGTEYFCSPSGNDGAAGSRLTFAIGLRGWLMILYIGIVSNALVNVCGYAALKYLKPGELGSFGYVSILLTVLLAFCFLDEKITLPFMLCLAMILLGTGMMLKISSSDNRQQKRKIS